MPQTVPVVIEPLATTLALTAQAPLTERPTAGTELVVVGSARVYRVIRTVATHPDGVYELVVVQETVVGDGDRVTALLSQVD